MENKISLVVPALSSDFLIEDYLINILFWEKKPSEIIIINTSKKILISKEVKNKLKKVKIDLHIIQKKNLFPGSARNTGIKKAKYDYILFLDLNTQPYARDWLKVNFDYLVKKKLDGIYGKTIYLANDHKEKIIRASTYGKAPLKTIPGSIFKKNLILKVGKFDTGSRAGEDTDWLKRLSKFNFKIRNCIKPIFYKGLFNSSYYLIIIKWFRNYYYSSKLPHMSVQKNIYLYAMYFMLFIFVFNWNYSTLCFTENFCLKNYNNKDGIFIPHITKIFLLSSLSLYTIFRGIYLPFKKKIDLNFLFPINFLLITFFSLILDFVKLITFASLNFKKIK